MRRQGLPNIGLANTFQSTHPGWGATSGARGRLNCGVFQSTHPGWGATADSTASTRVARVSIHAPRVGCDKAARVGGSIVGCFNPRTPGGVRHPFLRGLSPSVEFQSTHPGWGATNLTRGLVAQLQVSIHAPRVGCDKVRASGLQTPTLFQSTHPGWGATCKVAPPRGFLESFNPRTPGGVRHKRL